MSDISASLLQDSTCVIGNDFEEAYPVEMKNDSAMYVRVSLPPALTGPEEGTSRYRVEIMYIDPALGSDWQVRLGDLENARMGPLVYELNKPGSFTFTLPVDDPKAEFVQSPDREVRIWRRGHLVWWGVIVRVQADKEQISVTCATLDWYFTKRVFGRANRTNLVKNPGFEDGIANWVFGWWPGSPSAERFGGVTSVQDEVVEGQRSVALEQRVDGSGVGVSTGGFSGKQDVRWVVDPNKVEDETKGELWTGVAWMYVKSSEFQPLVFEANIGFGGLRLVRFSTTQFEPLYIPDTGQTVMTNVVLGTSYIGFDGETFDKWIRLETPILQPVVPGQAEIVALFVEVVPGARVYFDKVSLTREESSIWKGTDQGTIFEGIVQHAQDTEYGKSDLKIGWNAPVTGIKRNRVYKHQDHEVILDVLNEFPTLHDGMDWDITFSPTTRTAQAYFPSKGTRKPWSLLEPGKNIVSFSMAVDGQRVATSVIVIGDGEGSDVEEGGAVSTETLDGALILEKTFRSTPGSAVVSIGEQALRGVNRFKNRIKIPEVTISNENVDYFMDLEVGDVVPVIISYGWVDINEDYRIIQIQHNPDSELTQLTLNPVTEEF